MVTLTLDEAVRLEIVSNAFSNCILILPSADLSWSSVTTFFNGIVAYDTSLNSQNLII